MAVVLEGVLEVYGALDIISFRPAKGLAHLILNEECIRCWGLMHALGAGTVHMNHPLFR